MKLGLVTYQLAQDWDLDRILEMCPAHGFEGVELRATHAHGVEVDLSAEERAEVRRRFEDSSLELVQLGSAFEYHSDDPDELRRNVEGTKEYAQLAADVGAPGIKVRPNRLMVDKGIPEEDTLEQIGEAIGECAEHAAELGVEIRVEIHGQGTQKPSRIRKILDYADHPNVFANWNCNPGEVEDGSIRANFDLLAGDIAHVHMRDLCADDYPWLDLLRLLRGIGYDGYCCAEIPASEQPGRIMDYYRTVWDAYHHILDMEQA